ncbi:hypothetical protein KIN20_025286 [Parelaphostrongylus tenuis]|uniref:Uncharacterized protein n=1 Tax=Parelaphostrongylus tenuis TaxID=148309 RepID=A0AAD5QWV7_PARTN|nr:hypothetical protein KIN20_025286 [Parelaphostrongylus tenuis]
MIRTICRRRLPCRVGSARARERQGACTVVSGSGRTVRQRVAHGGRERRRQHRQRQGSRACGVWE